MRRKAILGRYVGGGVHGVNAVSSGKLSDGRCPATTEKRARTICRTVVGHTAALLDVSRAATGALSAPSGAVDGVKKMARTDDNPSSSSALRLLQRHTDVAEFDSGVIIFLR